MPRKNDHEQSLRDLLKSLGEDPEREGLAATPTRVLGALRELVIADNDEAADLLLTTFDAGNYNEWICLHEIPFGSLCEHHMIPFTGTVSIAYWPQNGRVVGLSKLLRLVDCFSRKLQLQERLTVSLAQEIYTQLGARAVAVRVEAEHLCMALRGVRKNGVRVTTFHRCGEAPNWPF
jgi:GTP cyclohydrolase I